MNNNGDVIGDGGFSGGDIDMRDLGDTIEEITNDGRDVVGWV